MANVRVCDGCGSPRPIMFYLKADYEADYERQELCSADCVALVSKMREVELLAKRKKAAKAIRRIWDWVSY